MKPFHEQIGNAPELAIAICLLFLCVNGCSTGVRQGLPEAKVPLQILEPSVSPSSFNPTLKEGIEIAYRLTKDSGVTIKVFDPDYGLVNTVVQDQEQPLGTNRISWDGSDTEGKIVPDQAYFFTIEAKSRGEQAIYDPTTFSGGEEVDITDVNMDEIANTVSFGLPKAAWVLGRIGIRDGPLLKTLLDWEPRPEGSNTAYWNGKDESGVAEVVTQPGFSMMVTTMFLPENSVIAVGNHEVTYHEYKVRSNKQGEPKQKREEMPRTEAIKFSRHRDLTRYSDRAPRFSVSLPSITEFTPTGLPIIRGKTPLRVLIEEADLAFLTGQRYEIALYVDFELYAEEEVGYSPFNWMWDTQGLPEGEHVLTVNVVSLNDQVGARSLKFVIQE
ncbi:MAG: FlgD immunoglobulin-like domain containing protein [Candidatus Eisenbacteria bacterium]